MIETHLKFVLALSATDEAPAYITSHLFSQMNPVKRIVGQFANKTHNFSYLKTNCFFFSNNYQFIDVCRTAAYLFYSNNNFFPKQFLNN